MKSTESGPIAKRWLEIRVEGQVYRCPCGAEAAAYPERVKRGRDGLTYRAEDERDWPLPDGWKRLFSSDLPEVEICDKCAAKVDEIAEVAHRERVAKVKRLLFREGRQ